MSEDFDPKDAFPVAKTIPFSEAGDQFTEKWLQDQICKNPSLLTLGDLRLIVRERQQWKNGRLDILLTDDDQKLFEVEVMLGETDEKHIIHTIEYWDNEKRKYPLKKHYPVLVAESFDRRFFNILHLFSLTIPLIAVQIQLIEVAGRKSLHFSKIIDTYQEPEDEEPESSSPEESEADWNKRSKYSVDAAKTLLDMIKGIFPGGELHYVNNYISVVVNGKNNVWIRRRGGNKSQIEFWFTEKLLPKAVELLDEAKLSAIQKGQSLLLMMDSESLKKYETAIVELAKISKDSWAEYYK
jgi:hypothetical protein